MLKSPFAFTQDELDMQAPPPALGNAPAAAIRDPIDPPYLPPDTGGGPGQPGPPGPVPIPEPGDATYGPPTGGHRHPHPVPIPNDTGVDEGAADLIPDPVPLPLPAPTGVPGTFDRPADFSARSTAGGGLPPGTSAYGPGAPLAPASGQRSDQMSDEEMLRAITRRR